MIVSRLVAPHTAPMFFPHIIGDNFCGMPQTHP
jgi:hypothetical protein